MTKQETVEELIKLAKHDLLVTELKEGYLMRRQLSGMKLDSEIKMLQVQTSNLNGWIEYLEHCQD